MANDFDRVLKESLGQLFLHHSKKYLGLEFAGWQHLDPNLTGTFERQVDHLYKAETLSWKEMLVHLEFQSRDDPDMVVRMAVYHALLYSKYRLPIIHQVIYLGEGVSRMECQLPEAGVFQGFDLLSMRDQGLQKMLDSREPSEAVLGILGNFGTLKAEQGVEQILSHLLSLNLTDTELKRSFEQLKILSRLRKLDAKVVTILKRMPIDFKFDAKKDAFYLWGMEEGEQIGLVRGEKLGQLNSALDLLGAGFSIERVAQLLKLAVEEIQAFAFRHKDSA